MQKKNNFDEQKETTISLPKSNLLQFFLKDKTTISIRPSGTEPKLKIYINTFREEKVSRENIQQKFNSCLGWTSTLEKKILSIIDLE